MPSARGLLLASAFLLASCGGGSSGPAPGTSTPSPMPSPSPSPSPVPGPAIQHIVIIFQENRTPDNLFHGLAGADIANSGLNSLGQTVTLQSIPLVTTYDLNHSHSAFKDMYDGGKMDGADKILTTCGTACPYANPQYGYVPASDNGPYMQMAQQYTFADRMFQTNEGPSFPAHQYIISGTSEPAVGSPLLAAENPFDIHGGAGLAGCDAPSTSRVNLIDANGSEAPTAYPCFEHPTLMDLLDAAQLSWRYYTPGISIWEGPNAIHHLRYGPDWSNEIFDNIQIFSDISSGKLAAVSWVIPTLAASDHARVNAGLGPSWVSSIVNAIGASPYWAHTAIFVIWDDWGGWYDHVPPQIFNSYELGFRVPLIVVSPYAKPGYVSHVQHEFGSLLKFTEKTFGLASLGYTDARADDLADCFDFTRPASSFRRISAPRDALWFRTHRLPAGEPDDDL